MGNKVEQFNAATQGEDLQAITAHKSMTVLNKVGGARDGKTRCMHAKRIVSLTVILLAGVAFPFLSVDRTRAQDQSAIQIQAKAKKAKSFDDQIGTNAQRMIDEGTQIFRFDTFGDEAFWGDMLKLHQAIEGASLGGVGPGVSPKTALSVGLKIDADAVPSDVANQLKSGVLNLDNPATPI